MKNGKKNNREVVIIFVHAALANLLCLRPKAKMDTIGQILIEGRVQ